MKRWLEVICITFLFCVCAVAAPLAALTSAPTPRGDGVMLVIGPDVSDIIHRAGGREVGPVTAPFGGFATGASTFAAKALLNGAWAVQDASWLATLCGIGDRT